MAFTKKANIDNDIVSQFTKIDSAKTTKENEAIGAEKATFLVQVRLRHQDYLDSVATAAATCSNSNVKQEYCYIKIQSAEENRDAIMSTWETDLQYL